MALTISGLVDWSEGRTSNITRKLPDVESFHMFSSILLGSSPTNIPNLYKRLFNNIKKKLRFKNDFFYSLMSRYKEHHQFPSQILKRELLSAFVMPKVMPSTLFWIWVAIISFNRIFWLTRCCKALLLSDSYWGDVGQCDVDDLPVTWSDLRNGSPSKVRQDLVPDFLSPVSTFSVTWKRCCASVSFWDV